MPVDILLKVVQIYAEFAFVVVVITGFALFLHE